MSLFYKRIFSRHMASIILIWLSSANFVLAADESKGGDWEILFAPYLWGVSLDGKTAIGLLPPVDIDASFSDILDAANIAGSLHTEFRKGKWTFTIDPTYLDLEIVTPTQNIPVPPPDGTDVSGKIKIKQWFVEGWASYQIAQGWELLGGVRWQSQEIKPSIQGIDLGLGLNPKVDEDWADLFAGVRWRKALGQKWMVALRGDLAIAGDSEGVSPDLLVLFNRRFGKSMALNLGYRYFENEYKNENGSPAYTWDIKMSGPIVGYTWQFGNVSWPR